MSLDRRQSQRLSPHRCRTDCRRNWHCRAQQSLPPNHLRRSNVLSVRTHNWGLEPGLFGSASPISLCHDLAAGDVVIAASPRNPRHIICKRVLGLEGDTVRVPVTSRDDARTVKARTRVSVRPTQLADRAPAVRGLHESLPSALRYDHGRVDIIVTETVVPKQVHLQCRAIYDVYGD